MTSYSHQQALTKLIIWRLYLASLSGHGLSRMGNFDICIISDGRLRDLVPDANKCKCVLMQISSLWCLALSFLSSFLLFILIPKKKKRQSPRGTPKDGGTVTLVIIVDGDLNISTGVCPWRVLLPKEC